MTKLLIFSLTFVIWSTYSIAVINGQTDGNPEIKDVTEGSNVQLECRFSPELSRKASTLYWIRTNRKGHDNVAIGDTPFQNNYKVEHKPEQGKYDLFIDQANYDRDNGQFECRMKEGGSGRELHSKSIELTVLLKPSPPQVSPSNPTATEGRPLNLTCASLGGSPPPQIQWFVEGQQGNRPLEANLIEGRTKDEPTESVLTIIPRKEDDGNAYRCTVENRALGPGQKLETSTKIFVNYFARVTVGPENPLMVERDETAQLDCRVDAKPRVNSVKWERDGVFIETQKKHTIPRVTVQDAGTYVCSADNGLGRVGKAELKLDVLYGPTVSLTSAQREFNAGDNIEVDCRVDANPRPSTIQWFKEGDERFVQNGPTLRLNGVTAANNGRYICSATNHLHPTGKGKLTRSGNATIDVNIRHRPGKAFITPESPKAIDGRRITLTCGANPPGYPKPTYRWWKDGSDSTLASGSEFTIDSARLNHAGKYYCQPSNDLGKGSTAAVDLEVNQAPKIITYLQSTVMKRAGDTGFHITCSAVGKPKPTIRWFKDGQEIKDAETNFYQINTNEQPIAPNNVNVLSTLKFMGPDRFSNKQLMPSDRGQYTCEFENDVDVAETNMVLRIEHSPVLVHQHNKVAFDLDETAFISCKMQAFPSPRFDWSYQNSILLNDRQFYDANITALGNDVYEGILRINKVTENSYGEYTCKGINDMGDKRTKIKLVKKGKPEEPLNVGAINIGYNFITIGFDPGFDGGFNDTSHSLEYRPYDSNSPKYVDCGTRNYCNITDLEQHSQYYIKVKAQNIKGESKYTSEVAEVTKIDVAKIPSPQDVHFEKTTNTASFRVQNDNLPLVAKVELENPNGNWEPYDELSLAPGSSNFAELPIKAAIINSLRIRLCLDTTNEILCGDYTPAKFVDVRPVVASSMGKPLIAGIIIVIVIVFIIFICVCAKCCRKSDDKHAKSVRPNIVHTTQPPPYHHAGIENKGVDTLKDADEMIKNNFGTNGYDLNPTATASASNSNSANGGSVNSQDSLWNVKGAPVPQNVAPGMQSQDPMMHHHMMNAYQMQTQGYSVYDAMAMQQHQQAAAQQQQQQQQQQLQQGYPEDYTHYPHPEEYLNERNQQFLNAEFYRHSGHMQQQHESDYSPYGDHHAYQQQMQYANGDLEEGMMASPQHYGQMSGSLEDAIDGGAANQNSGSYAAGQQQRRIIREIIV